MAADDDDRNKKAAATIGAWSRCWQAKVRAAGRGEQNAEMLFVSKERGELRFEDLGGWADRNASMQRIIRAAHDLSADGLVAVPDFAPVVVQTGDRCVVKRVGRHPDGSFDALELHLWQQQPLTAAQRGAIALERVLSMCEAPGYHDVAVPDWACDVWAEANLASDYDTTCAGLAAAAAAPAPDARACWFGTIHHHPVRMRLQQLATEHPDLVVCNNVYWTQAQLGARAAAPAGTADDRPAAPAADAAAGGGSAGFISMEEQVRTFSFSLDVQGKGYSSRVKFLLHAGRPLLLAHRPWTEWYHRHLRAWQHYIPVAADLHDLPERVRWAREHTDEARAIGQRGQAFARERLTRDALLREWRAVLGRMAMPGAPSSDA